MPNLDHQRHADNVSDSSTLLLHSDIKWSGTNRFEILFSKLLTKESNIKFESINQSRAHVTNFVDRQL